MGPNSRRRAAFTLIELLVVVAIVAILAALLFPVFARARETAKAAVCLSGLRQIGDAFAMYAGDDDDRMPDRRDLKVSLGYRPWTDWPPSDPRAGWAYVVLGAYGPDDRLWNCPSVAASPVGAAIQAVQQTPRGPTNYWLWPFDHPDAEIPLTDFWGKADEQIVADLDAANPPGPSGVADVELAVDPYFPDTKDDPPQILGVAPHSDGRNRLYLDGHCHWIGDPRMTR